MTTQRLAHRLPMDAATLEREALQLPIAERALLPDRILVSLDSHAQETLSAMGEEAERRLTAFENGQIEAVDGTTALGRLRRKLR